MTYNDYKNDLDGFYFISDENDALKFESFMIGIEPKIDGIELTASITS